MSADISVIEVIIAWITVVIPTMEVSVIIVIPVIMVPVIIVPVKWTPGMPEAWVITPVP